MPVLSLTLDHQRGLWQDRRTGETFSRLHFVFLGAQKRRSMWMNIEALDQRREVCSSPDGITGTPKSGFPWTIAPEVEEVYDRETATIPCEKCVFHLFDKHYWKAPPCSPQFVCPILFTTDSTAPLSDWRAAFLNVRGSSVRDFNKARDRIVATDNVWFAQKFESVPLIKSVKGNRFASANLSAVGKFEYGNDELSIIEAKYDALIEARDAPPDPVTGLKDALGIAKGQ